MCVIVCDLSKFQSAYKTNITYRGLNKSCSVISIKPNSLGQNDFFIFGGQCGTLEAK